MRMGLAGFGKALVAAAMLLVALWFASVGRDSPRAESPTIGARVERVPSRAPNSPCVDVGRLIVPVEGVRSDQLYDSFDDIRGEDRRHDALDIVAPLGQPVVAAANGRVEKLFVSPAGGNTIYVRSADGRIIYYYAHLDRYAPELQEGQAVRQGTRLGMVGYSGNADPAAPHLHFGMTATSPDRKWSEPGQAVNPFVHLAKRAGDRNCESAK